MNLVLPSITILCVLIQLIWLLFQYKSLAKKRLKRNIKPVSVIVVARNEESNLYELIPLLKKQKFEEDWEIIVVLDRCTDNSEQLLKNFAPDFPQLKYFIQEEKDIDEGNSPKKSGILKAVKEAAYSYILQTDADCRPVSEYWIHEMSSSVGSDTVFVIGVSPYRKSPGFLNELVQFDTACTASSMIYFADKGRPYMSLGRNQLFKKDYFLEKGGFGKNLQVPFGDDDLLIQHLNPKNKCGLCVTENGFAVSIPETNWTDWFRQKYRHIMAGKYYKRNASVKLGLNYLSFLFYPLLILWYLVSPEQIFFIAMVFLLRTVLFTLIFNRISARLNSQPKFMLIALVDLVHIYITFGIWLGTLSGKELRWK